MCINNNPKEVEKFQKKHRNHQTITVFKRLLNQKIEEIYNDVGQFEDVEIKGLFGPYKTYFEYKPGWNKSSSRRKKAAKKVKGLVLVFMSIYVRVML